MAEWYLNNLKCFYTPQEEHPDKKYVYLAVPEYSLWMIAETFPKILAYIRAEIEDGEYGVITREEKAVSISWFYCLPCLMLKSKEAVEDLLKIAACTTRSVCVKLRTLYKLKCKKNNEYFVKYKNSAFLQVYYLPPTNITMME